MKTLDLQGKEVLSIPLKERVLLNHLDAFSLKGSFIYDLKSTITVLV